MRLLAAIAAAFLCAIAACCGGPVLLIESFPVDNLPEPCTLTPEALAHDAALYQWLQDRGITAPEGSFAAYDQRRRCLTVRNTAENLGKLRAVLGTSGTSVAGVSLEVLFVALPADAAGDPLAAFTAGRGSVVASLQTPAGVPEKEMTVQTVVRDTVVDVRLTPTLRSGEPGVEGALVLSTTPVDKQASPSRAGLPLAQVNTRTVIPGQGMVLLYRSQDGNPRKAGANCIFGRLTVVDAAGQPLPRPKTPGSSPSSATPASPP